MGRLTATAWKRLKLLLSLLAVSAFVLLMPASFTAPGRVVFTEAVGPVETVLYQGGADVLATGGTLTEMFLGRNRQRALAREVVRLRNQKARLVEALRRERERLESIEKLEVARPPVRAVRAPVTAYESTAARRSVVLAVGSQQGVEVGMAAAAQGALIGILREVGPSFCRVRLITDPGSVVPCRLGGGRDVCLLTGTGEETCRVEWVGRGSMVDVGEVVLTAALEVKPATGLKLPDGLPVATVTEVGRDRMRPLFDRIEAEPRVDLTRLEEAEVLIPEP
jgi:rod shape-determining protein MreC